MLVAAFVLFSITPAMAQNTELEACVPDELRADAISFTTEDDIKLPGLVFGDGASGVLLAHNTLERICAWLPLARQLADDGYQVLLYQPRTEILKGDQRTKRHRYDLDVLAAAQELRSRGADSIVAGGAGNGATALAAVAAKIPDLKGVFLLSPTEITNFAGHRLDAVVGIGAVEVPAYVLAAEDDVVEIDAEDVDDLVFADHARNVADGAKNGRVEVVPGKAHGVALTEDAALRDRVRAFVREAMPPSSPVNWVLIGSGVVVLLLLVAGVLVVVLHRRNTTTPADVSAGS